MTSRGGEKWLQALNDLVGRLNWLRLKESFSQKKTDNCNARAETTHNLIILLNAEWAIDWFSLSQHQIHRHLVMGIGSTWECPWDCEMIHTSGMDISSFRYCWSLIMNNSTWALHSRGKIFILSRNTISRRESHKNWSFCSKKRADTLVAVLLWPGARCEVIFLAHLY